MFLFVRPDVNNEQNVFEGVTHRGFILVCHKMFRIHKVYKLLKSGLSKIISGSNKQLFFGIKNFNVGI